MVFRRSLLLLIALLLPTVSFATTTYVVKKGDNLYDLSRKYGVSVEEIKTLNKLDSINLGIGDELLIPNSTKDGNNKYVVKSGDTISEIAEQFGVKTKDLKTANKLKNNNLQIGQTLYIPSRINSTNEPKTESAGKAESESKVVSKEDITPEKTEVVAEVNNDKADSNVYIVKQGDTLGQIAEDHNVRTKQLKEANSLKNHKLQIGQKLVIPSPEVAKPAKGKVNTNVTVSNTYKVNKGDTVYDLANKFDISKENLKKWNNLDNNNLRTGQDLYLSPNKDMISASKRAEMKVKGKYTSEYKVKSGDTLGHIAVKHGATVKDLKTANNLSSNNLSIGQVLKVPAQAKKPKAVAKKASPQPQKTVRTSKIKYIVKRGDTLGAIANRHGTTVSKIKQASSLKNNKIKVGDVLLIPGNQTAAKVEKAPAPKTHGPKYTVVTGDTLGEIANKHGVTVSELQTANNLKNNNLYVGMKLALPAKSKIKTTPAKTAKKPSKQHKPAAKSQNSVVKDISIKEDIIRTAKKYLGVPYKFGGYSLKSGIDCSGYVKKIFGKYNIHLPRTARDIYYNTGTRVSKSQLQTGDLVFFTTYAKYPSHVGIYMGNGQFIHASSGARKVAITSLNKKYYQKRYIGAKRIPISAVFEREYSQK